MEITGILWRIVATCIILLTLCFVLGTKEVDNERQAIHPFFNWVGMALAVTIVTSAALAIIILIWKH